MVERKWLHSKDGNNQDSLKNGKDKIMNPKCKMIVSVSIVAVMFLTGTSLQAAWSTAYFKDGESPDSSYAGTQDTMLAYDTNADKNYGALTAMSVAAHSYNDGVRGTSLIRFDLSSLKNVAGLEIKRAILYLYCSYVSGTDLTVDVHEVLSANGDWVEGTATGAAQTGSSCWNYEQYNTSNWAGGQNGCSVLNTDCGNNPAGTGSLVNATGDYAWIINDDTAGSHLLDSMETWAKETADNAGFLLRGTSSDGHDGVDFRTSDYSSVTYRPKLRVDYTPEPATMTLLLLGLPFALRRRR